jgi:hypothetical protein
MKLENWALIAEIIGGVSIVLSLIFVGIEVRQSRAVQIQAGTQAVVSEYDATIRTLASDPELACIYARGGQDFSEISALQRIRLNAYLVAVMNAQQQVFGLMLDGTLEPSIGEGLDAQMREVIHLPGFAQWYETRSHWYGPEFRDYIQRVLDTSPDITSPVYDAPECPAEG